MLQLCDDEQRSSPTGCDTQCRSNVVVLGRCDHVANRDLLRRAREHVATVRATRAAHDARAAQPQEDLLDVVARAGAPLGDVAAGDRAFVGAPREVQRADDAVLGPGGDAHDVAS